MTPRLAPVCWTEHWPSGTAWATIVSIPNP